MGKEIGGDGFTADDFVRFRDSLALETRHAHDAFRHGEFAEPRAGWQVSNSRPG
ncbi:MAG: hypothetical protein V5B44_13110 [Candidatus Accumulibacter necessarius]|jgi:hypothetical protein|uniref:hypothetical protein n=1 Tax=Candidatus Accumulibacter necessarius TaxID=2954386 RepID=UPI002FC2F2C3